MECAMVTHKALGCDAGWEQTIKNRGKKRFMEEEEEAALSCSCKDKRVDHQALQAQEGTFSRSQEPCQKLDPMLRLEIGEGLY